MTNLRDITPEGAALIRRLDSQRGAGSRYADYTEARRECLSSLLDDRRTPDGAGACIDVWERDGCPRFVCFQRSGFEAFMFCGADPVELVERASHNALTDEGHWELDPDSLTDLNTGQQIAFTTAVAVKATFPG